jgi:hypothetical protein
MSRFKLAFALSSLVSLFALAAASSSNADFKKWLTGFSKQVSAAFAKKDAAFFERISTPDFSYTDSAGRKEDKKTSMANMRQMFAMSDSVQAEFKVLSVSVKGNTARANVDGHFVTVMKPGEDGKKHTMDMTTHTMETYKKSGKTWLIQKIVETRPGKALMDGKPVDPSKMGAPGGG